MVQHYTGGDVAAITAAAIAWIIAGDGVAFTFVIGGVEEPVDGNCTVLISLNRFGSKKSAGLIAGLKCRPSISKIIWTSYRLLSLAWDSVLAISVDVHQCFVLLLSLEEIGISMVYCWTSDRSVARIARRSMSSTLLTLSLARSSFFNASLVSSSKMTSRSVPEISCPYVLFRYLCELG